MEADSLQFFRDIVEILLSVNMAEYTVAHMMLFHEGKNVHGLPFLIVWGIVKDTDDAAGPFFLCQLDSPEQTPFLPAEDHPVIFCEIPRRLRDPAPRPRQSDGPNHNYIVVEKFKGAAGGFRHFRHRVPPVVMVAADYNFPSRKGGDPLEIGKGLFQIAPPRKIAGNNDCIVFMNGRHP